MAEVRLSDLIIPEHYAQYMQEDSDKTLRYLNSGIAVRNSLFDGLAQNNGAPGMGGNITNLPYWNQLDSTVDPDNISDNPSQLATPSKIGTGMQITFRSFLHKSWSTMDLASVMSDKDVLGKIQSLTSKYWDIQWEKRLVAATKGILLSNVANDGGDMVKDIALGTAGTPTAANQFSASAFIDTEATFGDALGQVVAIGVHSKVYNDMRKLNLIDFISDSTNSAAAQVPTYMGRQVIVSDDVSTETVNGNIEYTCVLFGRGAFGYGKAIFGQGVEIERVANAGYGGGQDILHERFTWILHPLGYKMLDAGVAGLFPTLAELSSAALWDRVYSRKQVPLAYLIVN